MKERNNARCDPVSHAECLQTVSIHWPSNRPSIGESKITNWFWLVSWKKQAETGSHTKEEGLSQRVVFQIWMLTEISNSLELDGMAII